MILDSNIIIYSIQPRHAVLKAYLNARQSTLAVSAMSKVEVLGYHQLTPADALDFEDFFATTLLIPVDEAVIDQATLLRQQRKMSLGDAIIAATSPF